MAEHEDVSAADGDAELDALLDAADRAVLSSLEDGMDFSRGLAAITGREAATVQEPRFTASGSAGGLPHPRGRGKRQRVQEEVTFIGDVVNMADGAQSIVHHSFAPGGAAEPLTALILQVEELRAHVSVENAEIIDGALNDLALARESHGGTRLRRTLLIIAAVAAEEGVKGALVIDLVRVLLTQYDA